jgi:copper chaperone CopZ
MKSLAIKFAALCAVFMPASVVFSAESVKVTVNGMVCAFCAQGIEKRLGKLPTTQAVFVDLKKRVVAVEAKAGQKLDDQLIRAEITDAGYDVVKLETSNLSVQQIKSEITGKK